MTTPRPFVPVDVPAPRGTLTQGPQLLGTLIRPSLRVHLDPTREPKETIF